MVGESRRRKKTLQGNPPKGLIYRKVCPLFFHLSAWSMLVVVVTTSAPRGRAWRGG